MRFILQLLIIFITWLITSCTIDRPALLDINDPNKSDKMAIEAASHDSNRSVDSNKSVGMAVIWPNESITLPRDSEGWTLLHPQKARVSFM